MFELKTTCKFEVGNKFITSEFDFGVKRKKTVLLLDEDKHFNRLNEINKEIKMVQEVIL